jgi:FkbM family methyltransferase
MFTRDSRPRSVRLLDTLRTALLFYHHAGLSTTLKAIALRRSRHSTTSDVARLHFKSFGDIFIRPRSSDWDVLVQIFIHEEYDPPSQLHSDDLDHFYTSQLSLGNTPCILDCGANIGLSAIWYSTKFPDARIFAVEPEPSNFALLEKNVRAFNHITPILAAISDHLGHVELANSSASSSWAWQTIEREDGAVETTTISTLLSSEPALVPFIVKVDIEGFERTLFRSPADWMASTPLVVFESHDWAFPYSGTAQSILRALLPSDRDYLQHAENTFAFAHFLGQKHAVQQRFD